VENKGELPRRAKGLIESVVALCDLQSKLERFDVHGCRGTGAVGAAGDFAHGSSAEGVRKRCADERIGAIAERIQSISCDSLAKVVICTGGISWGVATIRTLSGVTAAGATAAPSATEPAVRLLSSANL
jgi:hypothetical protein